MTKFSFFWKLLSIVALLFGVVAPAEASTPRHRFAAPSANNHVLAQKVRANLAAHPDGRHAIDGDNCGLACATPEDLVDMMTRFDPLAPHDVNQLAAYIDGLRVQNAPPGEYWMACKTGDGSANSAPLWNCLVRRFHRGEHVLVNSANGRVVMAGDCTNPVGEPVEPNRCIEMHVYLKPGDEVHIGWLGPQAFPEGNCRPAILRTGETEWSNALSDQCPRERCNFVATARGRNRPVTGLRWSWTATVEGDNIIRLPVEVLQANGEFALCVVRPGEHRQTQSSFVERNEYPLGRAYVGYDGIRGHLTGWNGVLNTWLFTDGRVD